MKGNNELHLCPAEMIVAVQEYLDRRMVDGYSPLVSQVYHEQNTFIVKLVERKPEVKS